MALGIDTDSAIRTVADRRRLVEAIRAAHADEQETNWVEWKTKVVLREKKWQAEIARQILGFANRHPGRAASMCSGCAYLALGVEPGNLVGVSTLDAAKLDDGVSRYVGKDGPQWSPDYVQVDGSTVLVITIEPPRWGDRIFAFEKEFEDFRNGDVFIRRSGKTERANAEEIRMLTDRAAARGDRLGVDLDWWEDPTEAVALDTSEAAVDRWIEKERATLLASSGLPQLGVREGTVGEAALEERIKRERPEHEKTVESYLKQARPHVRELWKSQVFQQGLGQIELAVVNLTEHNFDAVKVVMAFEGDVWSAFGRFDIDTAMFPKRPKSWASREKEWGPARVGNLRDALLRAPTIPRIGLDPSSYLLPTKSAGSSRNSGSTTLSFASVDLRPEYRHHIGPVHLMASAEHAGQEIQGSWYATSKSASGTARGVFAVRVAEGPLANTRTV